MKKVLMLAAALTSTTMMAHAQNPGEGWDMTNAGCTNVGTMIFKGQKGVIPHLLAMTTNGYSSTIVEFAVTTGTLGCDTSRPVASIRPFVDKNLEQLAGDMSRGQGESLTALATLLNVTDADQAQFNSTLQQQFSTVFADENVTSGQVVASIIKVLGTNSKLAAYAG